DARDDDKARLPEGNTLSSCVNRQGRRLRRRPTLLFKMFHSSLRGLYVLMDPVDEDVGHLEIIVVQHHHMTVTVNTDIGQRDEGHIATRSVDLIHLRNARSRRLRRWHEIGYHDEDGDILEDANMCGGKIGETACLKLNDASNPSRACLKCGSGRVVARF